MVRRASGAVEFGQENVGPDVTVPAHRHHPGHDAPAVNKAV